jgi:hypothetical protein
MTLTFSLELVLDGGTEVDELRQHLSGIALNACTPHFSFTLYFITQTCNCRLCLLLSSLFSASSTWIDQLQFPKAHFLDK